MGDGMGFEAVRAARMFDNGDTAPLNFETFPYLAEVTTANYQGGVTDSAAAGTAIATGHKVSNGVISMAIPGDGRELTTSLEILRDLGKRTGLVTTFTPIADATPASFGAHEPSRNNTAAIFNDYVTQTRPNVLMGRRGSPDNVDRALNGGYTLVTTADEMHALDTQTETHVAGLFTAAQTPPLPDMVTTTLAILDNDADGFFLMIEHEGTDTFGHANDLAGVIDSLLELRDAVDVVLAWAAGRDDTLILVTADHETGGLNVTETNPQPGVVPSHTWSTTGHTLRNVPLYALGQGAGRVCGVMDNTDTFGVTVAIPACMGDLNYDRTVDTLDLEALLEHFGSRGASLCEGDTDGDTDVDLSDLAIELSAFGSLCE